MIGQSRANPSDGVQLAVVSVGPHERRFSAPDWSTLLAIGSAAALGGMAVLLGPALTRTGSLTLFWLASAFAVGAGLVAPKRIAPSVILVAFVVTPIKFMPFPG